ncbi:MAG: PP2C family serine/threonine-protein phosphatase [Gemmatimonadaceae bacterium]
MAEAVTGAGHRRTGVPCQDAHASVALPGVALTGGALVAAVADGAGSVPFGGDGARLASQAAVAAAASVAAELATPGSAGAALSEGDGAVVTDDVLRTILVGALASARAALEAEALRARCDMRDLATTLIVAIAGDTAVAAAQVGDGAVIVRDEGGALHALTTPRHGEFINETMFLTAPDALETAQYGLWRGAATHLAVISDGLQMLALVMPGAEPHAPFFAPVFAFASGATSALDAAAADAAAAQLRAFLSGPRVGARTDDDVTLLLGVRP